MSTKKNNREKVPDTEDDRVVANMNIDGMPWHAKEKSIYPESGEPVPQLTRKELFRLTFNSLAAALLIAAIFIGLFFLFIMFCIHVWF